MIGNFSEACVEVSTREHDHPQTSRSRVSASMASEKGSAVSSSLPSHTPRLAGVGVSSALAPGIAVQAAVQQNVFDLFFARARRARHALLFVAQAHFKAHVVRAVRDFAVGRELAHAGFDDRVHDRKARDVLQNPHRVLRGLRRIADAVVSADGEKRGIDLIGCRARFERIFCQGFGQSAVEIGLAADDHRQAAYRSAHAGHAGEVERDAAAGVRFGAHRQIHQNLSGGFFTRRTRYVRQLFERARTRLGVGRSRQRRVGLIFVPLPALP